MKFRVPVVLMLAVLPLAAATLACQRISESQPPSVAVRADSAADHSAHAGQAADAPRLVLPVTAASAGAPTREVFTGSLDEVKSLIALYHSIHLTPEQERLKVEALSTMSAPCCKQYSLATCCCPCNMAKATWGLAAKLITEKGYNAEQIRQAEASWLERVNPKGFSGTSCFNGGCTRPMHADGCGGMKEEAIVF